MKLYNVPRNTLIRVYDENEDGSLNKKSFVDLQFHHVDGMYSYCKDKDGNVVHLPAWTEVWIVDEKGEYTS